MNACLNRKGVKLYLCGPFKSILSTYRAISGGLQNAVMPGSILYSKTARHFATKEDIEGPLMNFPFCD